ncbi:class I fructose-bisphosphate aldolase [Propionimicrobium lymphophilum]|uniref:class I fructose-bisphosphate aldolase n=1 Tax=Propionimicrobium lymphophilum TaxID=33012 RepID=UPI002889B76F|nr:fructose-bisphosphate aldolase [Propionimicrobium lymphophilum]
MSTAKMRMGKLFNKETGRAFVVAFDHGQALPIPEGLGNPIDVMKRIIDGKPEGILITAGMLNQTKELFAFHGSPMPIVRADWTTLDPKMADTLGEQYRQLVKPAEALAMGAEAICTYIIGWPEEGKMFAENIETVARIINEAHQIGLPVIVEATLWGSRIDDKKDYQMLRQMNRIAAELGADALKTEFIGDVEKQRTLIEECGDVPVLTLGGSAASPEAVAEAAQGAISAGAKGLIFGRNVWQVDDMESAMKTLSGIVHA